MQISNLLNENSSAYTMTRHTLIQSRLTYIRQTELAPCVAKALANLTQRARAIGASLLAS